MVLKGGNTYVTENSNRERGATQKPLPNKSKNINSPHAETHAGSRNIKYLLLALIVDTR